MKISTIKAAESLNIDPASFALHLLYLDNSLSFDDFWPAIEESWVQAIRATDWEKFGCNDSISQVESKEEIKKINVKALKVLDKLSRKRRWGAASVSIEAIQNLTGFSSNDVHEAIIELLKLNFIINHKRSSFGPYSLNPSCQEDIEKLCGQ